MLGLNIRTLHQQDNTKINTLSHNNWRVRKIHWDSGLQNHKKIFFPEDLQKETTCLVSISKPLNNAKIRNLASPILPFLSTVSNSAFEYVFASPVRMLLHSEPEPLKPSPAMGEPKAFQVDLGMWGVCPKTGSGTRSAQTRRPQEKALVSRTRKAQETGEKNTSLPMHAVSKWI